MAEFALDGLKALDLIAAKKARQAREGKQTTSTPDAFECLTKALNEKSKKRQEALKYSEKFGPGGNLVQDKQLDPYTTLDYRPQAKLAEQQEQVNAEIDKECKNLMARVGELANQSGGLLQQDDMGQDLVDLAMMERGSGRRRKILLENVLSKAAVVDAQRLAVITPPSRSSLPGLPSIPSQSDRDAGRAKEPPAPISWQEPAFHRKISGPRTSESGSGARRTGPRTSESGSAPRRAGPRTSESGSGPKRAIALTTLVRNAQQSPFDSVMPADSIPGTESKTPVRKLPPLMVSQTTDPLNRQSSNSPATTKAFGTARVATSLGTERFSRSSSCEPLAHSPGLLKSKVVGSYVAFLSGGTDTSQSSSLEPASSTELDAPRSYNALGGRTMLTHLRGSTRGHSSPGYVTSRLCEDAATHKSLEQHLEKILKGS